MKIEDIYPLFELEKLKKIYGDKFAIIREAWTNGTLESTLTQIIRDKTNPFSSVVTDEQVNSSIIRADALLNWNKYKQVYDFNDDLFDIITAAESFTFYAQSFENLPFDCFCINHQFSQFKCVIVDKTQKSLSLIYLEDDSISYIDVPFNKISEGRKIDDMIYEMTDNNVPEFYIKNILSTLNAIMYLCSEEPDIYTVKEPIPQNIQTKQKNKRKPPVISQNKVGMRIGHTIRENKQKYESTVESGTGSKKSPHMRKAHYHHYWTGGKNDKKLIVKFISSIFVNAEDNEIKATTIRKKEK